jgi:ABC-2 type transport system ATP-binding protein
VVDAADRAALRAELERRGITFSQTPLFRIDLNGSSAHEVLRAIDTPLTVVRVHAPSLEDAYLRIVGQAAAAEAGAVESVA